MEKQVIIIGAGIAGLAAANRLLEEDFTDFLIIEASNRIGGRIYTTQFQNSFLEIGAQWMHGTEKNPVYDIASSLDIVDESVDKADLMYYSTQDGKQVNEKLVENIQSDAEKIIEEINHEIHNEYYEEYDKSIGDFLDIGFETILKDYKSETDENLIRAICKSVVNNERFESSCDDLHDLSAIGFNNYETLGGNLFTNFKYGYSKVTEHLSSSLPKNSILLNQVVEKIDWSNEKIKITVYDNKENKRKMYTSSFCISTIPLGCLKRNHQQLFAPRLTQNKIDAINRLGFGCVNKLFVVFESNFAPDFQGLQILWKDGLNFELKNSKKKWNLTNNEFYKAFDNFDKLPNHKNILLNFTAGKNAEFIETLEDQCILDVISELIEKCFPYVKLPKPIKVIRSRWSGNAYSRGSYSYIKVGSTIDDMNVLAEPLDDKLFFAGESTVYAYAGTVHGAYISGYQAGKKIINILNSNTE